MVARAGGPGGMWVAGEGGMTIQVARAETVSYWVKSAMLGKKCHIGERVPCWVKSAMLGERAILENECHNVQSATLEKGQVNVKANEKE